MWTAYHYVLRLMSTLWIRQLPTENIKTTWVILMWCMPTYFTRHDSHAHKHASLAFVPFNYSLVTREVQTADFIRRLQNAAKEWVKRWTDIAQKDRRRVGKVIGSDNKILTWGTLSLKNLLCRVSPDALFSQSAELLYLIQFCLISI